MFTIDFFHGLISGDMYFAMPEYGSEMVVESYSYI